MIHQIDPSWAGIEFIVVVTIPEWLRFVTGRAARFLLMQHTKAGKSYQKGKNIPNDHKIYQMTMKYTKWP
jgi:hypothetical protein